MNKSGKIGIFDSGIGGVTVFKEILKILPHEKYLYYSDSKNNPYGNKTNEELFEICDNIIKFLLENNCKTIVIACNTASCKVSYKLREKYKYIPIIAIEPAYKMVYDYSYNEPTLVMATKGTIESERFKLLYEKYNNNKTYLIPCVGLADMIEKGQLSEIKTYLEKNISQYRGKIRNVVLGCTHYPLIKSEIQEVLGDIKFFYGAENLAKHLKDILQENNLLEKNTGKIQFIDSQNLTEKEERFFSILRD